MKKNGFTLIELLAVIVILAIIALIATPIILNIIRDARESANERSRELYATAVKTAIMKKKIEDPKVEIKGSFTQTNAGRTLTSASGDVVLTVEYDGDVQCDVIEVLDNYELKLDGCKVEGVDSNYNGTVTTPSTPSVPGVGGSDKPTGGYDPDTNYFNEHSWSTIASNVRNGNTDMYKVGDTKTISLSYPFGRLTDTSDKYYTVRIANKSTPAECNTPGFSQTACGFVIEFVDIITTGHMNPTATNTGGWPASSARTYLNGAILMSLPYYVRDILIPTYVVSGQNTEVSNNYTSTYYLYLLSTAEIWPDEFMDRAKDQTRQLDYYNQFELINSEDMIPEEYRKKYNGQISSWWLRTAHPYYNTRSFHYIAAAGYWDVSDANQSYGYAPAFRIG